jgi:hypothetical protein
MRLVESILSRTGPAPVPVSAVAVAIEAAVLPNRELGFFPLRRLPLGSRQRRAYQRTMDGPLIVASSSVFGRLRVGCGFECGFGRRRDFRRAHELLGGTLVSDERLVENRIIRRHEWRRCE